MMILLFILLLPLCLGHRTNNKSVCSNVELTKPQGELSSPGYPHSYPNDTTCTWMIFIPKNVFLSIHIVDIDIEESIGEESCKTPCCSKNWLSLSVDNVGWQPETTQEVEYFANRHCGSNASVISMMLSQRITVITFHTGQLVDSSRRGFKLLYRTSVSQCNPTEFRCDDYFCVDGRKRCNGEKDCADGSDEEKCSTLSGYYCPPSKVPCGDHTFECYDNRTQRCDGITNCENGIDEKGCGNCLSNELRCRASRECYKESQTCDGHLDCPFGDDEIGCQQADDCQSKIPCSNQIGCYYLNQRCDGSVECDDESDEKGCGLPYTPTWSPPCPKGPRCSNGVCIRAEQWCDGQIDCDDRSDETNCSRQSTFQNTVIAAAIMGSLVCGLLLVMAVGCFCRLYSMRMANVHFRLSHDGRSQFANTGPNPHQMSLVRGASHLPAPLEEEFWHREPPPAYSVAVGLPPPAPTPVNINDDGLFTIDQPSNRLPRTTRPPRIRTRRSLSSQTTTPSAMNNNNVIIRPRPRPRALPNRSLGFVCPTTSATTMVPLEIPSAHRYPQSGKSDKCNSDNNVLGGDITVGNINPTSSYVRELNNQSIFTNQSSLSSDNQSDVSPSRTSTTSLMSGFSETPEDEATSILCS